MTAMHPGTGPAEQHRTGSGGLGATLGLVVLGTGVVAFLLGFVGFYGNDFSDETLGLFAPGAAPVSIGFGLLAGLAAGTALLPRQSAPRGLIAAASLTAFLLVLFQIFGATDGTTVAVGGYLILVLLLVQTAAAVFGLLLEAGVASAPARKPAQPQPFGQPGGYGHAGQSQPGQPSGFGAQPSGGFGQPGAYGSPYGAPQGQPGGYGGPPQGPPGYGQGGYSRGPQGQPGGMPQGQPGGPQQGQPGGPPTFGQPGQGAQPGRDTGWPGGPPAGRPNPYGQPSSGGPEQSGAPAGSTGPETQAFGGGDVDGDDRDEPYGTPRG